MIPNPSTRARASAITLVASLVVASFAAVLPPAAEASTTCAPGAGVGAYTFSASCTTSGVFFYSTITIPAGVTITVPAPEKLTLYASLNLNVEGAIEGGQLIELISDQVVSISGEVRAADAAWPDGSGGSVTISGQTGAVGGIVQSGSGAAGGAAGNVGLPGAKGGDIIFKTPSLAASGTFIVGNGGDGGSVDAATFARGGDGGASGAFVPPATANLLAMIQSGRLQGGAGGAGGSATSTSNCAPTDLRCGGTACTTTIAGPYFCGAPGPNANKCTAKAGNGGNGELYGGRGGNADASCADGVDGRSGAHGIDYGAPSDGTPGSSGSAGAAASATAGNGGGGLVRNGYGGDARAVGGYGGWGGSGGRGGHGGALSPTACYLVAQYPDFVVPGFQGGRGASAGHGANGGDAEAYGGHAGKAIALYLGIGGKATAIGGDGGRAGHGGNGGWGEDGKPPGNGGNGGHGGNGGNGGSTKAVAGTGTGGLLDGLTPINGEKTSTPGAAGPGGSRGIGGAGGKTCYQTGPYGAAGTNGNNGISGQPGINYTP